MPIKPLEIPIVAGGRLITTPSTSLETVSAADFVTILNMYKDGDQLARIPGWVKFQPNPADPVDPQYIFDDTETVIRLAELVRGDGTRVLVGCSLTKIKFFDVATSAWVQIGSGYSPLGKPWQTEVMSNTIIFNNAVDMPQWWRMPDESGVQPVQPVHEIREVGIARVGRIAQYNGFLFLGDITEIVGVLALWMNGFGSYPNIGSTAKAADFDVLTAENRVLYQVTTGASNVVATLPDLVLVDNAKQWFFEKMDAGAGIVTTVPILSPPIELKNIGDKAMIFWNGAQFVGAMFPGGVIPPTDPYGIVPDIYTQQVADEQAWGELGEPLNWAPLVNAKTFGSDPSVLAAFRPHNWVANKTRIAVIGGGPDGGILGGDSLHPEGVLITEIEPFVPGTGGVPIHIETPTDPGITYPRMLELTRWSDLNSFTGKQRMGNGQRITVMLELNGILVTYQELGIFLTRWTGNASSPFVLRQKYSGRSVPMFGDCIVPVRNSFHLYPSIEGMMVHFDGLTDPAVHPMAEQARDVFFTGLTPVERCWAVVNPMIQTALLVRESNVFCFRYRSDSPGCFEMDAVITAATPLKHPGGTNDWFALASGRFVYQFAQVNDNVFSWLRDGAPAVPVIKSGLNPFRIQLHEKVLQTYIPVQASPSPNAQMTVQIRSTYNPSGVLTDHLVPPEVLNSPEGNNLVQCFFQGNYFQDELVMTDTRDIDFRLSARLFEFDIIGGMNVTRTV